MVANYGWTSTGVCYIDGHASTKIIIAFIGQKKLAQILRLADLEPSYSIKTSA